MELTKENIGKLKPKVKPIDLSKWFDESVTAYVGMIDGDTVIHATEGGDDKAQFIEWCANGLCLKNGDRLFENGDALALRKLPFKALEYIATQVMEFNGITEGEAEKN